MIYPDNFKNSCKREFPGCENLHRLLDLGDSRVGMCLSDIVKEAITLSVVNPSPENARMVSQGLTLYNSWRELIG